MPLVSLEKSDYMTMDHRCGARTPLDLAVSIRARDGVVTPGRVRDISIGGMRIACAGAFTAYQPVTLEFVFPPGSRARRWPAMVVHVANGTLGVMFEFFRATDLENLIELLRASARQAYAERPLYEKDDRGTMV